MGDIKMTFSLKVVALKDLSIQTGLESIAMTSNSNEFGFFFGHFFCHPRENVLKEFGNIIQAFRLCVYTYMT